MLTVQFKIIQPNSSQVINTEKRLDLLKKKQTSASTILEDAVVVKTSTDHCRKTKELSQLCLHHLLLNSNGQQEHEMIRFKGITKLTIHFLLILSLLGPTPALK